MGVTQVEGEYPANSGNYLPNLASSEFAGKTITPKSGPSNTSSHANTVATYFYGLTTGFGTGIDPINCYEVNHWITSGALRVAEAYVPLIEPHRVQNHSWIGEFEGNDPLTADALRRLDHVIDRDGVVVCVGVNNGTGKPMPKLLSSAYNVLAVGLRNANSSFGPTLIDVPGRVKPDIVASANSMLTSYATPVVGASASLLLETMATDGSLAYLPAPQRRTAEALLVKALLMGGATKAELSNWRKGLATPSTDGTVPLDYRYGAGDLNIDNSHRILTPGEQEAAPDALVSTTGWDFASAGPAADRIYFFEIPSAYQADTLSILLAWNRRFVAPPDLDRDADLDLDDFGAFQACTTGPELGPLAHACADADLDGDGDVDQSDFGAFQICYSGPNIPADINCRGTFAPILANMDLRLYEATDFELGSLRDASISAIDNVEHIWLQNLPAGRYAIVVNTDRPWDYALTWDAALAPAAQ
ncbi:MAG: hypothetical protein AMXMBFR13_10500 [Phycisphaerae bacterium]